MRPVPLPAPARPSAGAAIRWLAALALAAGSTLLVAMPPTELQQRIERGDKLTIIDVRSPELYAKSHIPGAINIPASLVAAKRLPALGEVVICGEGLGRDTAATTRALAELNRKPGIRAVSLDGGFSSWDAAQKTTTAERGMKREELVFMTYDQLKRSEEKLVLVDLRGARRADGAKSAAVPELSDLRREFPRFAVIKDPFTPPVKAAGAVEPVLVLIDRNDGTAEETARKLRSQGRKRVVVLAGGEEIIARQGRPGLERVGPGTNLDPTKTGGNGLNK